MLGMYAHKHVMTKRATGASNARRMRNPFAQDHKPHASRIPRASIAPMLRMQRAPYAVAWSSLVALVEQPNDRAC